MNSELKAMFERAMITPGLTFDGCMAEFARLVAEDCAKIADGEPNKYAAASAIRARYK